MILLKKKATTVPRILNESQNPLDYPKAIIGNHQCPIRNIPYAITSISVSYTHLDVYKRQRLSEMKKESRKQKRTSKIREKKNRSPY